MIELNISIGNRKMGAIPSFSLPTGKTCSKEACATCYKDGCYALAMERRYKTVRVSWQKNLDLLKEDLIACHDYLNWYFDSPNAPRLFRIHVGGDFFNREYFEMWRVIAKSHPRTIFMAFTKKYSLIHGYVCCGAIPQNLVLIASAWPGVELPSWVPECLPVAYMQDGTEDRIPDDAHLCTGDCIGECNAHCWNMRAGDSVVFEKHGNGIRKVRKDHD